jgi:hypothetical protein
MCTHGVGWCPCAVLVQKLGLGLRVTCCGGGRRHICCCCLPSLYITCVSGRFGQGWETVAVAELAVCNVLLFCSFHLFRFELNSSSSGQQHRCLFITQAPMQLHEQVSAVCKPATAHANLPSKLCQQEQAMAYTAAVVCASQRVHMAAGLAAAPNMAAAPTTRCPHAPSSLLSTV